MSPLELGELQCRTRFFLPTAHHICPSPVQLRFAYPNHGQFFQNLTPFAIGFHLPDVNHHLLEHWADRKTLNQLPKITTIRNGYFAVTGLETFFFDGQQVLPQSKIPRQLGLIQAKSQKTVVHRHKNPPKPSIQAILTRPKPNILLLSSLFFASKIIPLNLTRQFEMHPLLIYAQS